MTNCFFFNLLSLASLVCLLNSAALVVFGKGLLAFHFFAFVLFNRLGFLPVKQEYFMRLILTENLENANLSFYPFLCLLIRLYSEIFFSAFESLFNLNNFKTVVKTNICLVFFRACFDAFLM